MNKDDLPIRRHLINDTQIRNHVAIPGIKSERHERLPFPTFLVYPQHRAAPPVDLGRHGSRVGGVCNIRVGWQVVERARRGERLGRIGSQSSGTRDGIGRG